jgi:hypothetical protein
MGFMDENGSGGGSPLLKWNGNEGKFLRHGSDEAFNDEHFILDPAGAVAGYIRFQGRGASPERRVGKIFPVDEAPSRASLGDTDQSEWPTSKFGDEPMDPWVAVIELPLRHRDSGEAYVLTCQGRTAIGAARDLFAQLRRVSNESEPIIRLAVGSMTTRYGKRKKPVFALVGQAVTPASAAENKGGRPFNDPVGF